MHDTDLYAKLLGLEKVSHRKDLRTMYVVELIAVDCSPQFGKNRLKPGDLLSRDGFE